MHKYTVNQHNGLARDPDPEPELLAVQSTNGKVDTLRRALSCAAVRQGQRQRQRQRQGQGKGQAGEDTGPINSTARELLIALYLFGEAREVAH